MHSYTHCRRFNPGQALDATQQFFEKSDAVRRVCISLGREWHANRQQAIRAHSQILVLNRHHGPHHQGRAYGWVMLVPEPGTPYAGESIPMHGGAIFGYQSVIEHISKHHELIVLLDNTDSPKLYDMALAIRTILAKNP